MFILLFLLLTKMHAQTHNIWFNFSVGTVLRQCLSIMTSNGAIFCNSSTMVSHEKNSNAVLEFSRMIELNSFEHSNFISFFISTPTFSAALSTKFSLCSNLFKTRSLSPLTNDFVNLFGVPCRTCHAYVLCN